MIEVTFTAPDKVWGANKTLHWAQRSRLVRAWRQATCDAFNCGMDPDGGRWWLRTPMAYERIPSPALVRVSLPFVGNRRRDAHNFVSTVCKAIVDGLVDAGCWPDDTTQYVSVMEPRLDIRGDGLVTVRITERPDEAW